MSDPITALADRMGVMPSYVDLNKVAHQTGRETQIALLAAMGVDAATPELAQAALDAIENTGAVSWRVVVADTAPRLDVEESWQLGLEDGTQIEGQGPQLPVLPMGRHLLVQGARREWLLAAPPALPDPPRAWGVTAPLAGLRTAAQGGIGSYNDLRDAGVALAQHGAAFLGINPVHAGFPTDESAFSPYTPSHRQWLNTMHIATGAATGAGEPLIDYPVETRRQRTALRQAFEAADLDAFAIFRDKQGAALDQFATHQALSGKFGPYWNDWPDDLQSADALGVSREAGDLADDITFHAWAQYQAQQQLAETSAQLAKAGMRFGLYLDLAVGTHPHGAETWETPELFATGASLGAPPDAFSPDGQNWNLAPMVPQAMIADGFATFAAILRRQFQFAHLLRVDHILGFDRAFWVPARPGVPGAYIKMPLEAMLAVTRIEATRAGATVIGEDLGNIPAGLQTALKDSGLLGCRLILFEHAVGCGGSFKVPEAYDRQTLASFSTHDLPTWPGWRIGDDIKAHARLGHIDGPQKTKALAERHAEVAAFDAISEQGMHSFLANTAAQFVAVQIENVFDVVAQPNLPGTVDQYPNWRHRVPIAVDAFPGHKQLRDVAETMKKANRRTIV